MRPFVTIFGVAEDQPIAKTAVAAAKAGYAVVPVAPLGKAPLCTLTARELKAADAAAQAEFDAGNRRKPTHDCGNYHATTDLVVARRVFDRLGRDYGDRLNLGIVAGPSKILIVDADNAGPLQAFWDLWAEETGDDGWRHHSPTVFTPGAKVAGTWAHRDGGHIHLDLPDGFDTSALPDVVTHPAGFDIKIGMAMAVAPPSVRAEGRYIARGDVQDAPQWLLDYIAGQTYVPRDWSGWEADGDIGRWAGQVSWDTLLADDGWVPTGKVDGDCGCPTWTKPGGGTTSTKSATAHVDGGCSRFDNAEGHGPLHLWTTEPPDPLRVFVEANKPTVTKLQYVAAMSFNGDVHQAMVALGMKPAINLDWLDDASPQPEMGLVGTRGTRDEFTSPQPPMGLVGTRGTRSVDDTENSESRVPIPNPGDSGTRISGVFNVLPPSIESGDSNVDESPQFESQPVVGLVGDSGEAGDSDEAGDSGGAGDSDEAGDGRAGVDEQAQPHPFWVPEDGPDSNRRSIIEGAKKLYNSQREKEYLAWRLGLSGLELTEEVIDLTDGQDDVLTPTVAPREDGVPQFYRGRVNTIFGPSEAGKSWYTIACLAVEVQAGNNVLVVDLEDDAAGFKQRLRTVGLTPEQAARVKYLRPWSMLTSATRAKIVTAARGTTLTIIDSLDGYLAMQGLDSNHAVSVRAAGSWMKALAIEADTAVLLVDHSTEKGEAPSKMQMGSSAKKQFIDGATFRAERMTVWKPGPDTCRTMILAGKDRHGWAKAHATFRADGDEWGRMTELRMEPDIGPDGSWTSRLRMLTPPTFEEDSGTDEYEVAAVETRIFDYLRERPGEWVTKTKVLTAAGDKNARNPVIVEALKRLVRDRVIEHRQENLRGGKTGHSYRYLPDDDLDAAMTGDDT